MRHFIVIITLPVLLMVLTACNLAVNTGPATKETPPDSESSGIPVEGTVTVTGDCQIVLTNTSALLDTSGDWGQDVLQLDEGATLPVTALSSNGWYQVAFGGDGGLITAWVAPHFTRHQGDCSGIPRIDVVVPLTDCKVTNNSGEAQNLRRTPEINADNIIGRFPAGTTMTVIKKQDGWYMVYVEAFSNSAWIEAASVSASPECANL